MKRTKLQLFAAQLGHSHAIANHIDAIGTSEEE